MLGQQETVTEEKLDWWMITIICVCAFAGMALIGYIGYIYYKKWRLEKEHRKEVERELELEEDGVAGFYGRMGVEDQFISENPLHMKSTEDNMGGQIMSQAEMIHVDDDAPFQINENKRMVFGQQLARGSDASWQGGPSWMEENSGKRGPNEWNHPNEHE